MKYQYNFGDGSAPVDTDALSVSHHYDTPGDYTIKVTTAEGQSDTATFHAGKPPAAPQLDVESITVQAGDSVEYDITMTNDEGTSEGCMARSRVKMDGLTADTVTWEWQNPSDDSYEPLEVRTEDDGTLLVVFGPAEGFTIGPDYDETSHYRLTIDESVPASEGTIHRAIVVSSGGREIGSTDQTLTITAA